MERRKQTGHICRWMAVGIMLAEKEMLSALHQNEIIGHQKKQRQVADVLDSLSERNEAINEQLQKMMGIAYRQVEDGIMQREQQIASLENN